MTFVIFIFIFVSLNTSFYLEPITVYSNANLTTKYDYYGYFKPDIIVCFMHGTFFALCYAHVKTKNNNVLF